MTKVEFVQSIDRAKTTLMQFLGRDEKRYLKFVSSMTTCIASDPKLLSCTPESLMGAFYECARVDLFPSNQIGECYILPYKDKAQFQMGYKGFVTLFYRSGVSTISSDIVRENDKFENIKGTDPKIIHIPADTNRGKAIGAYAFAKLNGEIIHQYMNKEEIMKIKELSPAKTSKYSPWNSNQDPQKWMWQKTVIKQLAKLLPTTEALSHAIHLDNVCERGGYIDGKNSIVEKPFITPEVKIDTMNDKKAELRAKKKEKKEVKLENITK